MPDLIKRKITFGGDRIPAYIGTTPHIIRARRKVTVTEVAGTNREVVEMEDAWEPYDQPYSLFVGDGTEDCVQDAAQEVANKLYKTGWQTLHDEYEPEIFRLAYFTGPFDVENRYTRLGKFDITFRCRPERFLNSGSQPTEVASGKKITNPTQYKALPLIHVTGSGNGTLIIQGQTITLKNLTDYINIDSEIMDCYRLPSENMNSHMEGSFPALLTGENTVTYTGGISSVTITPRFFVI